MVLSTFCTTHLAFMPLVLLVSGPLCPLPSLRPWFCATRSPMSELSDLAPTMLFAHPRLWLFVKHPQNGALCHQVHLPHGPTTLACSRAISAKSGTLCATWSTCHTQINNTRCHLRPHNPLGPKSACHMRSQHALPNPGTLLAATSILRS